MRSGFVKFPILAGLTDNIKVCLYSHNIHIHQGHTSDIIPYHHIMLILTVVNAL